MLKKNKPLLLIIGILFFLAGIIFNTSIIELFTADGNLKSSQTIIFIRIVQTYLIVSGILLIGLSLVTKRFTNENRFRIVLLCITLFGFTFTIIGLILNPAFIIKYYSPDSFLAGNTGSLLSTFRLVTITLSFIIFFLSLLIYIRRYFKKTRYTFILTTIFIMTYFVFFYFFYIQPKFPDNILLKTSEYEKVANLLLGNDILLSDFEPRSNLKVARKLILKSKFPVIDVHFHLASLLITENDRKVLAPESLIKSMDSVGVKIIVNLDDDNNVETMLNRYARKFPDRFINFTRISLSGTKNDEWFPKRVVQFENSIDLGARGLKIVKSLGLKVKDSSGRLVPADDPRFDPLWSKVGELGVPVLWHSADPTAFFQPIDKYNERYLQLIRYPEWSYYGNNFPSKETILKQRENVLRKHPNTIIIGGHMGQNADDLKYLGYLLDMYPNFFVEISSALVDLGRQPYTARKFFIKYQDRILFGTDGGVLYNIKGWTIEKFYRAHFEFLETENEFIDYPMRGAVIQGDWKIYGLNLPDEVLEKIYYKNAEKILVSNKAFLDKSKTHLTHVSIK